MLEDKKAIMCDLDGTLINSMWVWDEIDLEFLGARGLALPEDFKREIEGMSFTETAEYSIRRFGLTESVEELMQIWKDMARDKYAHEVTLKPGVVEFLTYCKSRGLTMGIATSNSRELAETVLQARGLLAFIETIVTSCEVKKGKPAPDVYLEAARQLHARPQQCLVFEDIPAGILAGKRAGMQVCAVEDSYSVMHQEEKHRLADFYIEDYREAIPL